jgi:hypothetical protein
VTFIFKRLRFCGGVGVASVESEAGLNNRLIFRAPGAL